MDVMKKLTTALLFIITVGAAGYAVRTPQTGLAILIAAGGTLFFVSNPKVLLITLVCVGVSNLRLPGVGGRLSAEGAVFALVIGYGFI
jgi:hypothetical protein